jgi:hypothetical protein
MVSCQHSMGERCSGVGQLDLHFPVYSWPLFTHLDQLTYCMTQVKGSHYS